MRAFLKFISYHNAVPLALMALFGAAGAAFAASPEVREAVYSAAQEVRSVDNTFIANADLDRYTPRAVITGVSEDDEFYYVSYVFTTIALQDYVWQNVDKLHTIRVSKRELGAHLDLGLFITKQLKELIDQELAYLREVQAFERRHITHKTVATAYGGLVGRFLDETTESLPGYVPVVAEPPPPPKPEPVLSLPGEPAQEPHPEQPSSSGPEPGSAEPQTPAGDTTPPLLQMLGDNPARVEAGSAYTDLGVVATDDSNGSLEIRYFVNGAHVEAVAIDTSAAGEWAVRYEVFDAAGNLAFAERRVEVYAPAPPAEDPPPEPPPVENPPEEPPPAENPPELPPAPEPEP